RPPPIDMGKRASAIPARARIKQRKKPYPPHGKKVAIHATGLGPKAIHPGLCTTTSRHAVTRHPPELRSQMGHHSAQSPHPLGILTYCKQNRHLGGFRDQALYTACSSASNHMGTLHLPAYCFLIMGIG
ncbi:Hypothetical predicted protein, partial [Pelobates cultripes]